MKSVDTIARIRREYFVCGKSIKQIVRELHVSRNTVRKVLRSDATEFSYERDVQPLPKLGRFTDQLEQLLMLNEAKPSRERLTLIGIFEELRDRGYAGSYDAVRRYARSWQKRQASLPSSAYVPLSFAPGDAYQFDWSYEIVVLAGVTVTVKVAHIRLCHSRMMFVRAYPRETQEPPRSPDLVPFGIGLDRLADGQGFSMPTTEPLPSSRALANGAFTII